MTKQNSVPAQALPRVAWKTIMREIRSRTAPRKPRAIKVGASIQEIAEKIQTRQTPRFYGLIPEQAALLARFFPQSTRATIEEARLRGIREREAQALAAEEEERSHITAARKESDQVYSTTLSRIKQDEAKARQNLQSSIDPLAEEIVQQTLKTGPVAKTNNPSARPVSKL